MVISEQDLLKKNITREDIEKRRKYHRDRYKQKKYLENRSFWNKLKDSIEAARKEWSEPKGR